MCVAIVQPKKQKLDDITLSKCWQHNPDGAGFAYLKGGKVEIESGFKKLKDFMDAYRPINEEYGDDNAMLVHFRIRSAGGMGKENCHPFQVKGGAMIHNGTLFYPETVHGDKSDTYVFAERMYEKLTLENVRAIREGLRKAIGSYNKLAFLFDTGDYEIINEQEGVYRKGSWFSNSYWER